jgi:hypothetical protein
MLQTWELPDKYITQLVVTYQIKTHIFSWFLNSNCTSFFAVIRQKKLYQKMMEIDKSTQSTLEEQMFYKRRTLQELTGIRHNETQQIRQCIRILPRYRTSLRDLQNYLTYFFVLYRIVFFLAWTVRLEPHGILLKPK